MTEAQRLLERTLTDEERELLEWHSPKAGWWRREKRDDICQGCAFGLIENCVTRNVIFALAESRAREGELVAALEKIGCSFSILYPCITSLKDFPNSMCLRCCALVQRKKE
ncbi:MAG TPA: hypothetical protein ENH62_12680 [Marinobacter sp.]|uniref:Uncharacterized protein n=1 Tax=marine sediment metagenome TaxID=412755 RepID=A0A0F9F549_9ZZZZ|nr:hypothetical protein [Marinobacter sp.]